MNGSSPGDSVPLRVRAADEATEIFLIDSRFNRIASGVGELETDVPPGLYKVRYRAGETQIDRFVEIPDAAEGNSQPVELQEAAMHPVSMAPVTEDGGIDERHTAAWNHAWDAPDIRLGHGAGLFLLVPDAVGSDENSRRPSPWSGITLLDAAEDTVCDPSMDDVVAGDGFASMNLALTPGVYVLRTDTPGIGVQKMSVGVCSGWQTHVLLATGQRGANVSLADASVFMARLGGDAGVRDAFASEHVRLTELARQGLAQGRSQVGERALRTMLRSKFQNPMLGILGTHLLLRTEDPDRNLLSEVVTNLTQLIPDHPDVRALRLAVRARNGHRRSAPESFEVPPMLWASWNLVVQKSVSLECIVPLGSLADRIGYGELAGTTWLVWRQERQRSSSLLGVLGERVAQAVSAGLVLANNSEDAAPAMEALGRAFSGLREHFSLACARSLAAAPGYLTSVQSALIRAVATQGEQPVSQSLASIARSLGISATTLAAMAADLLSHPPDPDTYRQWWQLAQQFRSRLDKSLAPSILIALWDAEDAMREVLGSGQRTANQGFPVLPVEAGATIQKLRVATSPVPAPVPGARRVRRVRRGEPGSAGALPVELKLEPGQVVGNIGSEQISIPVNLPSEGSPAM